MASTSGCNDLALLSVSRSLKSNSSKRVLAALACAAAAAPQSSLSAVLLLALKKALKSGSAGFLAGTVQVLAFMWLRTTMNYQYKFGGTLTETLKKLYAEGGIARLYKGLFPWAIFQAPLSRFGDVAANEMVVATIGALFPQIPVTVSTFAASMTGAMWRVFITPIDTVKTILQTDGEKGMEVLKSKMKSGGVVVLWHGWEGNYLANVIGNYPWFVVMNLLSQRIPVPKGDLARLIRSAGIGAGASSVSDVVSNSIRVVKTKKQTHADSSIGYGAVAKEIIDADGVYGLFFRGLETRIFTNVMQGAFFTILWKYLAGTR